MTTGKLILTMVVAGALGIIGFILFDARWPDEESGSGPPLPWDRNLEIDHLDRLPRLRLPTIDGREIAANRWAGKVLVLNFWATWCPPCLRELPLFDELQRTHADAGLQIVGIAIDRKEDVERFLVEHPVDFPILLGDTDTIELSRRLGNRLQGLPFTAIFDADGKRVYEQTGEVTHAALTEHLEPLLSRTREPNGRGYDVDSWLH
ncbi:MAG: Cytochrome c-type biogenesis protein ResA [Olavius algarvensis Gamma 1 endosymbiont]|nr:MAG: Cytochrome c-type biogenesis protein ResA [Olavius algarvensis Gamma 1 endosymbiont]